MEPKIIRVETGAFVFTVSWPGGQYTGEAQTFEEAKAHLQGWLRRREAADRTQGGRSR
jgi:hypothetical protein